MTKQNMLTAPPRMVTCYMTQREPHTFIDNGGEFFEGIISQRAMEKKCNG